MSKEAYELLLKANDLHAQGNSAAAVEAYREVLKSEPTATQRQVAEAQLRELGELPYTFASSGRVLHKSQAVEPAPQKTRKKKTRREASTPPSARRSYVPTDEGRSSRKRSASPPPSRQKPRASMELSEQIAALPPQSQFTLPPQHPEEDVSGEATAFANSEKIVKPRVLNPVQADSYTPYVPPEHEQQQIQAELLYPALERLFRQARYDLPSEKLQKMWDEESGKHPFRLKESLDWLLQNPHGEGDEPREPQQKNNESDEEFERRLWRYKNWLEYRKTYPDIDINVAEQLHEQGVTLKEFKEKQVRKTRHRRRRKRRHMRNLQNENQTLPGTSYLEEWVESEQVLWFWGAKKLDLRGRLVGQDVFYLQIRPYLSKTKRYHKTDIQWVSVKQARKTVLSNARLAGEYNDSPIHKDPYKRPEISDAELSWSVENETELFLHFHSNLCFPARVIWFDPFQMAVEVDGEDEVVELFVFRHALLEISRKEPKGWDDWEVYRRFEQDGAE